MASSTEYRQIELSTRYELADRLASLALKDLRVEQSLNFEKHDPKRIMKAAKVYNIIATHRMNLGAKLNKSLNLFKD